MNHGPTTNSKGKTWAVTSGGGHRVDKTPKRRYTEYTERIYILCVKLRILAY